MSKKQLTELLSIDQMADAEKLTISSGASGLSLMEAAGRSVVREIRRRWTRRPVMIFVGPGNNGGDGFVLARILGDLGWPIKVIDVLERGQWTRDAKVNADRWCGKIEKYSGNVISDNTLIIDAIFGAGLARDVDGGITRIFNDIRDQGLSVVAIDIPSGIDGNTGKIRGSALRANLTVTFFRKKIGQLLMPGREYCGETVVKNIGILDEVLSQIGTIKYENVPMIWKDHFPNPAPHMHKYNRGNVAVIGESVMIGASLLASAAARRIGAGLVTIMFSDNNLKWSPSIEPGCMYKQIKNSNEIIDQFKEKRYTCALVGPGNGQTKNTENNVISLLKNSITTVIDADALSVFHECPEKLFENINGNVILTPHEGEFRRLFGDFENKVEASINASNLTKSIIVFKGYDTIIAEPQGRVAINSNASPYLATGGTGDVLSGLILGLIGQGMPMFEAACAAVWLTGGISRKIGPGLIAEDVIKNIPSELKQFV
ncbi:MAG: bifunctional ADP-dependent NAD(P)H-hydrate dehydratase/NAD(P)H-hydrate epimerase [Rhodospirillaceae bacterium]|nr:bifunctional ADP-dependent NAD(P)H-hydrate dehydratase/NAD(P)H-hydrate epimerase [Rhodospirillaceae bacterium]